MTRGGLDSPDWHFAARQLREVVIRSRRTAAIDAVDAIHRDPGLTGIAGWDAIIGGVAAMTGRGRVSDTALLDWCFDADRYCASAMFDPFGTPEKYFWTDYLRTPVELRVRNVVYPWSATSPARSTGRATSSPRRAR